MSISLLERKALLGMAAIGLFLGASLYQIGMRNLWFETKNVYYTRVKNADGLRVGSEVTIAGLRVGDVSSLEVDPRNEIQVTLSVMKSVASRIREDSSATVFRAYVIGDKRIEILPGAAGEPLADGAHLPAKETTELMEFISGKKLAELMGLIESLMGGVNRIVQGVDQVMDKYDSGDFNKTFARLDPALENFLKLSDDLIVMTKEMKKRSKDLPVVVEEGVGLLVDLRQDLFANDLAKTSLTNINKIVTPLARREQLVEDLLANLQDLSRDLRNNPKFAQKMVDALQELTITLKALQRTWLLESKTEEVKKESKP